MTKFFFMLALGLSLIFSPYFIQAQSWSRMFGDSPNLAYGFSQLKRTLDGGLLLVGHKSAIGSSNLYIVKTDKNGILQWQKEYPVIDSYENVKCVYADNNSYIIMGNYHGRTANAPSIFFLKIDKQGNEIILNVYGAPNGHNRFSGALLAKDNNIVVFANEGSLLDTTATAVKAVKIYKLNLTGDTIWTKRFKNIVSTRSDISRRPFVQTSDNGFLFPVDSFVSGYTSVSRLLKLTESGNLQWIKETPNNFYDILPIGNGRYVGQASANILVFDEEGRTIWTRSTFNLGFTDIGVSLSGRILISSDNNILNFQTNVDRNNIRGVGISKLSLFGQLLWSKNFVLSDQAFFPHIRDAILNEKDTCFVIAGAMTPSDSKYRAWVTQYVNCNTTSSKDLTNNSLKINILQNPMIDESQVIISDAVSSTEVNFQLFDISGRLVLQEKFENNIFTIKRKNLMAGLYILKIETSDGKIGTQKLVVQ